MNVRLAHRLKSVLIAVWKNAAAGNPLISGLSGIKRTKSISFDTYQYRK